MPSSRAACGRSGEETDSPALVADGHHLQTDVLTSLGVLLGLVLVRSTGQAWWDPVAALCVCAADPARRLGLAREALSTLSDTALPRSEERVLEVS